MKPTPSGTKSLAVDAHTLARCLSGLPLDDELDQASPSVRAMVRTLTEADADSRADLFHSLLAYRPDGDTLLTAVMASRPDSPLFADPPFVPATVADVRRARGEGGWLWEGWIPAGAVCGLAAFEGIGKTRLALDLAARIYRGDAWPDGQPATLSVGTRTLWLLADGHHDELADILPAFGLPDEAVVLPTSPDDVYGGTDLDDATFTAPDGVLDKAIEAARPGLIVVDTLTYATDRNLSDQSVMKGIKTLLVGLAKRHHVPVLLLLHMSREGHVLGRRIKGITRTLIQLEQPDPNGSKLRLWIEKSFARKPAPLGVEIGETGNAYDDAPPARPETSRHPGGRPSAKGAKAKVWLLDELARDNDQMAAGLCDRWVEGGESARTFWRAVDALRESGEVVTSGGPGTGQRTILHATK